MPTKEDLEHWKKLVTGHGDAHQRARQARSVVYGAYGPGKSPTPDQIDEMHLAEQLEDEALLAVKTFTEKVLG